MVILKLPGFEIEDVWRAEAVELYQNHVTSGSDQGQLTDPDIEACLCMYLLCLTNAVYYLECYGAWPAG